VERFFKIDEINKKCNFIDDRFFRNDVTPIDDLKRYFNQQGQKNKFA